MILFKFGILLASVELWTCKQVSIKIIDEPNTYGLGGGAPYQGNQESTLHMRVPPSNFSGPPHLHALYGRCFSRVDETYKYELCPFFNVTQHEQSLRWNPYSGVLGVWQEWEIVNNTFTSMKMAQGDNCGQDTFRSVKVKLQCGEQETVGNVTEPTTCHYEMIFYTPLVCHPHSLLVYPVLPTAQQQQWDKLVSLKQAQYLTDKGYKRQETEIFEEAGLVLHAKQRERLHQRAQNPHAATEDAHQDGNFDTIFQCSQAYKKLEEKIAGLKTLLQVHGITDDGDKSIKHPAEDQSDVHQGFLRDEDGDEDSHA